MGAVDVVGAVDMVDTVDAVGAGDTVDTMSTVDMADVDAVKGSLVLRLQEPLMVRRAQRWTGGEYR